MGKSSSAGIVRCLCQGAVLIALVVQCGCASYPSRIEAGMSRDEVLKRFGAPAVMRPGPDGERWVYPTGPFGQYAFGVNLDATGRVESVHQVLTIESFAAIQVGQWTEQDVLWHFGPPADRRLLRDLRTWDYRYREGDVYNSLFTIAFDTSGVVARAENGPDWMFDGGGRGHGRR